MHAHMFMYILYISTSCIYICMPKGADFYACAKSKGVGLIAGVNSFFLSVYI